MVIGGDVIGVFCGWKIRGAEGGGHAAYFEVISEGFKSSCYYCTRSITCLNTSYHGIVMVHVTMFPLCNMVVRDFDTDTRPQSTCHVPSLERIWIAYYTLLHDRVYPLALDNQWHVTSHPPPSWRNCALYSGIKSFSRPYLRDRLPLSVNAVFQFKGRLWLGSLRALGRSDNTIVLPPLLSNTIEDHYFCKQCYSPEM